MTIPTLYERRQHEVRELSRAIRCAAVAWFLWFAVLLCIAWWPVVFPILEPLYWAAFAVLLTLTAALIVYVRERLLP
jgi:hypothetical protein